ncbi:hypothetical protein GE09DRAFT_393036 [Coniochaeta sp. 2T2.1]|nr:hypothetical protein GE09DRAFT_393036 [Coniochaeta sp. 2T2.1]
MARNRDEGMHTDSLADRQAQELEDNWLKGGDGLFRDNIVRFVTKHRQGKMAKIREPFSGSYNTSWRLDYEDGGSVCFCVPKPGAVSFPDEKTSAEVATMRYIAEHTSIPVPRVYHWGTAAENPTGLGAFIIMDYIKHHQTMNNVLAKELQFEPWNAEQDAKERPGVVMEYVPDEVILYAYKETAKICLQLSSLKMPKLGSLANKGDSYELASRPLTQDMNDLPLSCGYPHELLPPVATTYSSSHEWYSYLADRHINHLVFQYNNAVLSEDDCRDKFAARCLFRQLIRKRRYPQAVPTSSADESDVETFHFYCDDFRPASVLIDENMKVVGVIDWEWSYFAPSSYASDPPWWLICTEPDFDVIGFDSWCERYKVHLDVWLNVLKDEETKFNQTNLSSQLAGMSIRDGSEDKPLSVRMRENWDSGAFWVNFAARKPYSFEPMYWKQIDERFYGPNPRGGYKDRLALLSERARKRIDWLVAQKMKEDKEKKLVDWTGDKARAYACAVLASFQ